MGAPGLRVSTELSSLVRVLETGREIALLSWRPKGVEGLGCAEVEAEVLQIVDDAMPGFDVYHCATRAWASCGQPVAIAEVNRALRRAVPAGEGALLLFNDEPGRTARDVADLFMRAAQMVSDLLEFSPRVPSGAAFGRPGGTELGRGRPPSQLLPAMGVPSAAVTRGAGGTESGRGGLTSISPAATARPSRARRGLVLAVSPVEGAGETATQTGAPPSYPPNPFGAGWRSLPLLLAREGA